MNCLICVLDSAKHAETDDDFVQAYACLRDTVSIKV